MLPSAPCIKGVPLHISSMSTVTQLTLVKAILQHVSTIFMCVMRVGKMVACGLVSVRLSAGGVPAIVGQQSIAARLVMCQLT